MSNNNTTTQETTFWKFLTDNTIEIPIIQRDYAQGRLGKEYLRKSFLVDIKNALDNALKDGEKPEMKLDFVYGSVENNKLSPLDGQQRLTTLWLLHWYIALMSRNLNEDICEILKKFTYETRISSREFCQNLCKPENFKDYEQYISIQGDRKVVEFIISRTWFYSAWKQDPTIQSMLRMLGGTEISDKNGEDIVDGLEEIFKDTRDFGKYWDCLISEKAPIVFYQLPLENFGLSDDLYIKMNARGKQLTSFENFKADLVGYIRGEKQKNNETVDDEKKTGTWSYLLSAENGIPIKMDTTWTNIFWKNKSKDNKIDEIYFAFLNRFFLCELICQKENNDYLYSAEKLEKDNSTFNYLYGKESNDKNIEYVGWEKYGDIPSSFFNDLNTLLDNHIENFQEFFPEWANKGSQFQFIPEYKEDNVITTLTQSERVVFHAISKYLQKGDFDVESFKQWMRVVWNIVENANINSIATMIGAIRLIDELGEHSHKIYEFLASEDLKIKSEAAEDQVKEEIAKAKQIVDEKGSLRNYDGTLKKQNGSDYQDWEDIIIVAESSTFFKGAIRFLITDEKGEVTENSWRQFEIKWKNAKEFFSNENIYYYENKLLRTLIGYFDSWESFKKIYFDNRHWKSILLNKDLAKPVHNLLINGRICDFDNYSSSMSNREKKIQEQLVKTNILDCIRKDKNYYMEDGGNLHSYYTNRNGDIYLGRNNRILLINNKIISNQRIEGYDGFYGNHIDFIYNKVCFRWYGNPNGKELDVYLMEEKWNDYIKRANPTTEKNTEDDEWYCFRVTPEMEEDTTLFTTALDCLVDEAKQNGDLQAIEEQ